ncbi:MAG TPA: leucine--tRNA ligase [Candidatus Woesebacteria bacterium]|nr:leucine--tRNA ligase [Candidatus Woesebacteria bacterium]
MDFKEVETKWLKKWEEQGDLYVADSGDGEKKYILNEFPYPSGSGLHIGHVFSFTGGDIYARFKRMQGYKVLFPMGWDAFGLPTENYAIKTGRKPQEISQENINHFREQMKRLAFSFDWSREVNTADPNYYKWTQWIFIQLFKRGLAYKQEMPINWCPGCKIGLANEEVVDGKCERCGHITERRNISQWVIKITKYADRLLKGLEKTDFINKVKQSQINWIGKSEGAKIRFKIITPSIEEEVAEDWRGFNLEAFTTRPDTLPGVTFMVIAPEHELVEKLIKGQVIDEIKKREIRDYVNNSRKKSDLERTELNKEKTGVFTGLHAINPWNKEKIPVWISDFVLSSYGSGAVMSVPAHDERDHEFAVKFGLKIIPVIEKKDWDFNKKALTEIDNKEGIEEMLLWIKKEGVGEKSVSYHLRDWIFSRQHYWGEPIPMVYCEKDGWQPVEENDLPVMLPEIEKYEPTDDGQSPLSKVKEFVNTRCPVCGGKAKRESDTMPNWAGSDWYFLRYIDPNNDIEISSKEKLEKWLPVDFYIGGDEHNTLHLLYSRFIYQFLYDLGVVPSEYPEPYVKRVSHGVILGMDGQRMSKSRGNVVVPESVAERYGVDVLRLYLMFMGPFESTMAWNENTLIGVKRFLERFEKYIKKEAEKGVKRSNVESMSILHKSIADISRDLEELSFNTAIAKLMKAINNLGDLDRDGIKDLIKLIAPMAPYTAEELWFELGEKQSVHKESWPKYNEKYLIEEKINVPIAINGKVRKVISISKNKVDNKDEMLSQAMEDKKIKALIDGREIVKQVYVSGKMLNLVLR